MHIMLPGGRTLAVEADGRTSYFSIEKRQGDARRLATLIAYSLLMERKDVSRSIQYDTPITHDA